MTDQKPNVCFICKNEATKKTIDVCDRCRKHHLAERILCIEAEANDGAYILKGRHFTIHESDFIEILGVKPNTLSQRFCFMNDKAFNILIERAEMNSKFQLLPLDTE